MSTEEKKPNPPDYYAKIRAGSEAKAAFEQIGAAWTNDKGAIFVKLSGKQIIDQPFTLFPVEAHPE